MRRRDVTVLRKIAEEAAFLEGLLEGVSLEEFLADGTMERAAAMAAINIGELAKHLTDEFYEAHPNCELRFAAKTRDVYAHGYYTLRFETVYTTAVRDYPRVKAWIEDLLDREGAES